MARDTQTKISRLSQLSNKLLAKYVITESNYSGLRSTLLPYISAVYFINAVRPCTLILV